MPDGKKTKRALTTREKVIAWVTFGLVVCFGIKEWIFKPAGQHERLVDQEILETNKIIKKNQIVLHSQNQNQLHQDPMVLNFFRKGSVESQMSDLTALLESLANQSGLTITEMKPLPSRDREFYQWLGVDVNLEGRYQQIIDFLYSVQNKPNFLSVEELNIEAKPIADGTMFCRVTISRMLSMKDQP